MSISKEKVLKTIKKILETQGFDCLEEDDATGELLLRTGFFVHDDDEIHVDRQEKDDDELVTDPDALDGLLDNSGYDDEEDEEEFEEDEDDDDD